MNGKQQANNGQNKIKVVHILPTLDKGGAERLTVDLLLNIDQTIFAPTLILFKRGGEWLKELEDRHIPVIVLEKKWQLDIKNFWLLLKALRKIKPQIVHTHLGGDVYGRLAAKLLGAPLIISTEHNINRDEGWLQNILKRITNRLADKIIAVSEAVKKDVIKRYNTPAEKITVILNGLEVNKFLAYQKSTEPKNTGVIFGTMGRLSQQKGQKILIAAWERLQDKSSTCLIAGSGSLAQELEADIREKKLEKRVKLVGQMANPAAFLQSLNAFIFPSLWEGLGIALLEAGLIGLPIIASDVDGIPEIVDETTGWLVPAGDAAALSEKINWLAANLNSPEVKQKTEKMKQKVIDNFSISKIAGKYQSLYKELLRK